MEEVRWAVEGAACWRARRRVERARKGDIMMVWVCVFFFFLRRLLVRVLDWWCKVVLV